MNKILNINLGGYALTIDDDAYEYLSAYLDSIRRRFSESEGRDEIVNDIEARLGELLSQSLGSRTIVMLPDVEGVIQIMGKPEDFGSDSSDSQSSSSAGTTSRRQKNNTRTGKRLFRDEEDAVVGGVCSGLSAYFGVQDPVWMRLIFVLLAFVSFGFWVPAYLLLWILLPPAKTAADRLSMRGEPVNVDNIAREIEDGFERLSTRMNEFGKAAQKKGGSANQAVSAGVSAIGQIFAFIVRFFAKFGLLIAILVGLALFISIAVAWVAGIWGLFVAAPFVEFFSPYSSGVTWLGFTNLFFVLSIPVVGLCLMLARLLLNLRTPNWLTAALTIFWFVNLMSGIVLGGTIARDYIQEGSVTKNIDLSGIRSDTLRIESADFLSKVDHEWSFDHDRIRITGEHLQMTGQVEIRVYESESNNFECKQTVISRGGTVEQAEENAGQITYNITTDRNVMRVPTEYWLEKGKRWRVQEVKLSIGVPRGKYIVFGKRINEYARSSDYSDMADGVYFRNSPDQLFKMTSDGLECVDCPKVGDRNYRGERSYNEFIIEGGVKVEIRKGDDFRVEIDGPDKDAVKSIISGDKMTFTTTNGKTLSNTTVLVETPDFYSLFADDGADVVIRGFDVGDASVSARGNSHVKAYLDVNNLDLALSGKCSVDLTGECDDLDVSLTDNAVLEAGNWKTRAAHISAKDNTIARIFVSDDADLKADPSSKVTIAGNARVHTGGEQ